LSEQSLERGQRKDMGNLISLLNAGRSNRHSWGDGNASQSLFAFRISAANCRTMTLPFAAIRFNTVDTTVALPYETGLDRRYFNGTVYAL
jgi:hypothetical protein